MRLLNCILLFFSLISFSQNKVNLSYYFSNTESYNQEIPKPNLFTLGEEQIGNSHISHDRLVQYMYSLATASDRISITDRSGFITSGDEDTAINIDWHPQGANYIDDDEHFTSPGRHSKPLRII